MCEHKNTIFTTWLEGKWFFECRDSFPFEGCGDFWEMSQEEIIDHCGECPVCGAFCEFHGDREKHKKECLESQHTNWGLYAEIQALEKKDFENVNIPNLMGRLDRILEKDSNLDDIDYQLGKLGLPPAI